MTDDDVRRICQDVCVNEGVTLLSVDLAEYILNIPGRSKRISFESIVEVMAKVLRDKKCSSLGIDNSVEC